MNIIGGDMQKNTQLLEAARKIVNEHAQSKTIHELSKKSGLSRSYLQHFSTGKIITPGVTQVECILRAGNHKVIDQIDLLCI